MTRRAFTNKELSLLHQFAEEGLSMSRAAAALCEAGYPRTKSGVQSARRTYGIEFSGERGAPLGNHNRLGKILVPALSVEERRQKGAAKMRRWRAANPDYLSREQTRESRRRSNKKYYKKRSADVMWRLEQQKRNQRYRAQKEARDE